MYPNNLKYNKEHLWAKIEGNTALIGVSFFAQKQLGDVLYVELPEVGDEITAGESFGVIESSKTASELIAPLSGEIVEVNEKLDDEPEYVNESPYDAWIVKIEMKDEGESDELLESSDYENLVSK